MCSPCFEQLPASSAHRSSSDPDHCCKGPDLCLESARLPMEVDTERVSLLLQSEMRMAVRIFFLLASVLFT